MKCFKKQHREIVVKKIHVLEQKRAKNLNPGFVATFYSNLQKLYYTYNYTPHHIWNCNKSTAHAEKDGEGYVLAKRGARAVHKVTTDQYEWLIVLSCINTKGDTIPNFLIFKGKRKSYNFFTKTGE